MKQQLQLNHFDAVIFDMDGVLIDSEPLWTIAMKRVFEEVECRLSPLDFQRTVGFRIDEVVQFWYQERGWAAYTAKEVEQKIVEEMVTLIEQNGAPLPGVMETVNYLKSAKVKIGLATSSYRLLVDTVLEVLGLKDAFDETHSAEHEKFGKPHPAVYMTVADRLDVDPMKCLVIEDSFNGLIAGKAAKMTVACIPEKTHLKDERLHAADFLFDNMFFFLNEIQHESIGDD